MQKLKKELIELLKIVAPSGKEQPVVEYTLPILELLCDKVWIDTYGNLLAEKKVGIGEGATVLLSAHMDSVNNLHPKRKVVEKKGVIKATKGILGADDRAGIATILAVLRNIERTDFQGTLQLAFPREEEIGCVGSSKINKDWIKKADLAIVIDRRGNKDIVVGTFGQAFCSNAVASFFTECSSVLDADWAPCEGGISDACSYSEIGVNSVNLSVGYMNEHTEDEFVVIKDVMKTVNLILQSLVLVNSFVDTFGDPTEGNDWIEEYPYSSVWGYSPQEPTDTEILLEEKSVYGNVTAAYNHYEGTILIKQSFGNITESVYIEEDVMEQLVNEYLASRFNSSLKAKEKEDQLSKECKEKHGFNF